MKPQPSLLLVAAALGLSVSSCSLLPHGSADAAKVIYALPARQPGSSPLGQSMTPIGKPFSFSRDRFVLTEEQTAILAKAAPLWVKDKVKLLVVGFAKRELPPAYARVLAHRRAEALRQVLIEHGLDAGNIHSTGYGNDIPSMGAEDSVVIYQIVPPTAQTAGKT